MNGTVSAAATGNSPSPSRGGDGMNPSLLIISGIVFIVCVVSVSIHFLLRHLSRRTSSPLRGASQRTVLVRRFPSSAAVTPEAPPPPPPTDDQKILIESLPLFIRKSSVTPISDLSPDCAVCLSSFSPDDQLRLLPYCCHAFHAACIDTWLRSSLSCPLCRTSVIDEPLPPTPPPPPAPAAPPDTATASRHDRSGSLRIEIGSASRRITVDMEEDEERVTEEDLEAVVTNLAAEIRRQNQEQKKNLGGGGEELAEGGGGGGSRNRLRGYVDRMVSSASSSFSSLRFSARSSRRHENEVVSVGASWDLDWVHGRQGEDDASIGALYNSFYRWLIGA